MNDTILSETTTKSSLHNASSITPKRSTNSNNISYENYAPRSESQRNRLSQIELLTSGPTSTERSSSTATTGADASKIQSLILMSMSPSTHQQQSNYNKSEEYLSSILDNEDDDLETSSSFSTDKKSSTLQKTLDLCHTKAKEYSVLLDYSKKLNTSIQKAIDLGEDLSFRHSELLRRSGELSLAAEKLQAEEATLSKNAEEIGMPLKHYDAVDRMGTSLGVLFKHKARTVVHGIPKVKVDSEEFETVLDDVDLAYDFFQERERAVRMSHDDSIRPSEGLTEQENCTVEYHRRVLALHDTALSLIRDATVVRINTCATDIMEALQLRTVPLAADKLEASLVYTRFHGISSRCNSILVHVTRRLEKRETYRELLDMARTTYCSAREMLLKHTIRTHVEALKETHGLVGMTRIASLFLMKICTIETTLFLDFFSDKSAAPDFLPEHDDTNGVVSKEDTIEQLAKKRTKQKHLQTKSIYKVAHEDLVFQKSLEKLCTPFARSIRRGLVSLSDLDILCQVVSVLREEQINANASRTFYPASRVISVVIQDAQERLIFCANSLLRKDVLRFVPTPEDLDYPSKLLQKTNQEVAPSADPVQIQLQIYESWFPPMRSVLKVLSKLFRVVEPKVFEDIAQSSVHACATSLKEASVSIHVKSGVIHSDLFLVKHLLILREQLSPFDIHLRAIERQLDFSEAGKAMTRFLANRNRKLFSMGTENALVTLLREGISVQESNVDSKRDLEDALRSACNDFIEHTSMLLAQPLFQFALQCKLSSTDSGGEAAANPSNSTGNSASSPADQPFLNSANVLSILQSTKDTITKELQPNILSNMNIYLNNSATQNILLKPILRKIHRSLEELKAFTTELCMDGLHGWSPKVRSDIQIFINEINDLLNLKGGNNDGGSENSKAV